jgi:hypothetical protein
VLFGRNSGALLEEKFPNSFSIRRPSAEKPPFEVFKGVKIKGTDFRRLHG